MPLNRHKKIFLTGKMSRGITNFQIENALKNLSDEDINDNFVGVFSANQMNRFINDKTMISEKKGQIFFYYSENQQL